MATEREVELEAYTEWTVNRAGLFDRLLSLRDKMRFIDATQPGNKIYVIKEVDKTHSVIDIGFERLPLLQALDSLVFSTYCDLRESREDGAEIGMDILHQHAKEG